MYIPSEHRYDNPSFYRRCGKSGLLLPAISLGLWHNFGSITPFGVQQSLLRTAFDNGITHFDLANNYGPPYGEAERNFGIHMERDWHTHRDELIISTKAGYDMWPGPYGDHGSRKYLIASLDQSLKRMHLDYVDIFYHHRPDPDTPIEETMGALDHIVKSGKALYVGISNYYDPEQARTAIRTLRALGTPMLIHQPNYSMFNRSIENGLDDVLREEGVGCIAFAPLNNGLLTARYADRQVPEGHTGGLPRRPRSALSEAGSHHPGQGREGREAERHRRCPRPESGADGAAVGAQGRRGDLRAHRREPPGADHREHPRAGCRPAVRSRTRADRRDTGITANLRRQESLPIILHRQGFLVSGCSVGGK